MTKTTIDGRGTPNLSSKRKQPGSILVAALCCLAMAHGTVMTRCLSAEADTIRAGKAVATKPSATDGTALAILDITQPPFGAVPDDAGDDTDAFLRLTAEVNRRGGGVRVLLPRGRYLVGRQTPNGRNGSDGLTYRYDGVDIMLFKNCPRPIVVEGVGAVMQHPDGMRFGGFDAAGKPRDDPQEDTASAAITGFMVGGAACRDLTIKGLELDGNNRKYQLGGLWGFGDKPQRGRQTRSYGLYFIGCDRVQVEAVNSHHFGLDGVYIKYPHQSEADAEHPHRFVNCRFEYNGRQGMSWSGGKGLTAIGCKFNHTGYAVNSFAAPNVVVRSEPGSALDIEEEQNGVCRLGRFIDCEFLHSSGPSLYGEIRYPDATNTLPTASFENCTFWNFQNYALWPNLPRLEFNNCRIYGATVSAFQSDDPQQTPKFRRCDFEDRSHPEWGEASVDYGAVVSFSRANMKGLLFEECSFVANTHRALFIRNENPTAEGNAFTLDGCTVSFKRPVGLPDVATLQGGTIRDTRFIQTLPEAPAAGSFIYAPAMRVGKGVTVEGRHLHWNAGGPQGEIAPTP